MREYYHASGTALRQSASPFISTFPNYTLALSKKLTDDAMANLNMPVHACQLVRGLKIFLTVALYMIEMATLTTVFDGRAFQH